MAWVGARYRTFVNGSSLTPSALNAIQDRYLRASGIGADDLDEATLLKTAGLTTTSAAVSGAKKRRGLSLITTEESFSPSGGAGAYVTAPTPDQVSDIVVESNGLLLIRAFFGVKRSIGASANVRLFISGQAVAASRGDTGEEVWITQAITSTNFAGITTGSSGFTTTPNYADFPAAKGAIIGSVSSGDASWMVVEPGAGTWTVSLKFDSVNPANVLTVRQRRLWVEAVAF